MSIFSTKAPRGVLRPNAHCASDKDFLRLSGTPEKNILGIEQRLAELAQRTQRPQGEIHADDGDIGRCSRHSILTMGNLDGR